MVETPYPDLETWVAYFSQAQLPVLRHTVHELDQLRANAERVNGRVLSSIILQDPMMTLRVLAYIESHRRKSQTSDITTIERALMMIGVEPFFRDFHDLPLIEDSLKPYPHALLGLLKVIARARRATHWARDWAVTRHDLDVDEITVATLLYDVAEVLMWCFAPGLALRVREIQTENRNLRSSTAQLQVYNIQLHAAPVGAGQSLASAGPADHADGQARMPVTRGSATSRWRSIWPVIRPTAGTTRRCPTTTSPSKSCSTSVTTH